MHPLVALILGRVHQLMDARLQREIWHDFGTVTSYTPLDHTAKVVLSNGQPVGPLPIQTLPGFAPALPPGTQVEVTLDRGHPVSIRGVLHSVDNPPTSSDMALEGDAAVGGVLTLGSLLSLGRVHDPPTPQAWMRGAVVFVTQSPDGVAGVADGYQICAQDDAGNLDWHPIPFT